MNAFTVLMAVMFGIYLMNFISSFLVSLTEGWRTWVRVLLDIFIGFVLLFLLVISTAA